MNQLKRDKALEAELKAPPIEELEQLIEKFAPIVWFHPDEKYMPVPVERYLQKAWLVNATTKERSFADIYELVDQMQKGSAHYLELRDGATLHNNNDSKTYVQARPSTPDHTDLQYWFLYPHTGPASATVKWLIDGTIKGYEGIIDLGPLGQFNGCWERITVRVNNLTREAEAVFFSQPGRGTWVDIDKLQRRGSQVLLYAAKGNYTFYPWLGFQHPENLRFNLYSSQLEFCIRHDIGKGRELNFAGACELVSASYLGAHAPVVPQWLDFNYPWTNPSAGHLNTPSIKRQVQNTFGKTLEFLLNREILDELTNYLLLYYTVETNYKSMAPAARACWIAEEDQNA